MTTITTRTTKGAALTYIECDDNFKRQASAKTANYTCVVGDNRDTVEFNGSSLTGTVAAAATMTSDSDTGDFQVTYKNLNSSDLTVARASTDTFDGQTSLTLHQYQGVTLKANQAADGYNIIAFHNGIANQEPTHRTTITSDFTTTSTSLTDVTGLVTDSLLAGRRYKVRFFFDIIEASGSGAPLAAAIASNAVQEVTRISLCNGSSVLGGFNAGATTLLLATTPLNNTDYACILEFIVYTNATTGGTIKLQCYSGASSETTTVRSGAHVEWTLID